MTVQKGRNAGRRIPERQVAMGDTQAAVDATERGSWEAECFVADYLGLQRRPFDLGRPDPGYDLLYRGWEIDVKWSRSVVFRPYTKQRFYWAGLRVPSWKPLLAMLYVAVNGDMPPVGDMAPTDVAAFKIDGFASRAEVRLAPRLDFGYGAKVHALEVVELHSREVLRAMPEFDPTRSWTETLRLALEAVPLGWRY